VTGLIMINCKFFVIYVPRILVVCFICAILGSNVLRTSRYSIMVLVLVLEMNSHSACGLPYLTVHCESKKLDTILMSITSRKIYRFSRFFHW